MKMHALRNASNGTLLAGRVGLATTAWERGLGLLPRAQLAIDEGLWIEHCSAIHTMLMRVTIDVFFVDKDGRVLRIANAVRPNRFALVCQEAVAVVELGASLNGARDVLVGDRLVLE